MMPSQVQFRRFLIGIFRQGVDIVLTEHTVTRGADKWSAGLIIDFHPPPRTQSQPCRSRNDAGHQNHGEPVEETSLSISNAMLLNGCSLEPHNSARPRYTTKNNLVSSEHSRVSAKGSKRQVSHIRQERASAIRSCHGNASIRLVMGRVGPTPIGPDLGGNAAEEHQLCRRTSCGQHVQRAPVCPARAVNNHAHHQPRPSTAHRAVSIRQHRGFSWARRIRGLIKS